ncbi:hypothetical protein N9T72_00365 [bacterium]|nr:hypothetical protein [bacterium]
MSNRYLKVTSCFLIFISLLFITTKLLGQEKIIQREQLSFEKCLKVISISTDRLSISPEVSEDEENKRVAVFSLSDGILKITCDGAAGLLLVSTN